ncbi:hypothetical protein EAN92_27450 [Klebsiella pneumoniae]|nr:hypothetical protein EAN92_27450 [Klebsiella pneumoniae]
MASPATRTVYRTSAIGSVAYAFPLINAPPDNTDRVMLYAALFRSNYPISNHHESNYHCTDNNHPYSHAVKLQDGRSVRIRLFALYEVSGSVPR